MYSERLTPRRFLHSVGRTLAQTDFGTFGRIRSFSRPPILVGGCGRSGTTLLLSMLGAHPHIAAIPFETALFARRREWPMQSLVHRAAVARAQLILSRQDIPERAHRWCEKTPGNVYVLPKLLKRFGPDLRFVHLVRDGRDVVSSKHPEHVGAYVPVERWVRDVSMGLRHQDDPRVYTLRYEALVTEYESTMRKLLDWLDEPFTPEMAAYEQFTTVRRSTAWKDGKVRPVSTSSVEKWRRPEYADTVAEVMGHPAAAELIERLGYPLK